MSTWLQYAADVARQSSKARTPVVVALTGAWRRRLRLSGTDAGICRKAGNGGPPSRGDGAGGAGAAASKTIAAAGGPAPFAINADLRKLEGCQQAFNTVKEKFNRCDVLVNSAGATKAGNFVDLPDEAWMDGYSLKMFGCVRMCRLFWPMLKAANGFVVNIGGGAARSPGADFAIGASVNAAMGNFSKALSQLGKRDGVNVNVIHPGATDTERFYQLVEQRSKASGKSSKKTCCRMTW